ncbi:unnamed protein product [Ectocarpus sp. CCAP 1310/34]|nr:unnamed protein product [Ectocarpus sp. CCAP 1310/34]
MSSVASRSTGDSWLCLAAFEVTLLLFAVAWERACRCRNCGKIVVFSLKTCFKRAFNIMDAM